MSLTDLSKQSLKPGTLEVAGLLTDVLSVIKNPAPALKELQDRHSMVKDAISQNQKILDENKTVLQKHAQNIALIKSDSADLDSKKIEVIDREKNVSKKEQENRELETRLNKKDRELKERETVQEVTNTALNARADKLKNGEDALAKNKEEVEKIRRETLAKQEQLKSIIG